MITEANPLSHARHSNNAFMLEPQFALVAGL